MADAIRVAIYPGLLSLEILAKLGDILSILFGVDLRGELRAVVPGMHVLELLEIPVLEHIKLILLLPESGRILTVSEPCERLLPSKRPLLVNARSVDQTVEVGLVGRADRGHQEGEADDLQLVVLRLFLAAVSDSGRLQIKPRHHLLHLVTLLRLLSLVNQRW